MAVGSGPRHRPGTDPKVKQAAIEAAGAKIVTGAFLPKVPEPELPLGKVAKKKYLELATDLLNEGKLTKISRMQAEAVAASFGEIHRCITAGVKVSAALQRQYETGLYRLHLAEQAKLASEANVANKFAHSGFAYSRSEKVTIRRPS